MEYSCIGLITPLEHCKQPQEGVTRKDIYYSDGVLTVGCGKIVQRLNSIVDVYAEYKSRTVIGAIAAWDTGSMTTIITNELATRLALQSIGTAVCSTPAGAIEVSQYMVGVRFADGCSVDLLKVMGMPLEKHECDILIGMDVISKGDFHVWRAGQETKFSFKMD